MHEQIARPLYYLGVHLLYASFVWLAAWILTSIPRGSATAKYWIWLATSLNFMLPLGALVDRSLAGHLSWASPLPFIGGLGLRIARDAGLAFGLGSIWLCGAALMFARLWVRLRAERITEAKPEPQAGDTNPAFFIEGVPVGFGLPSEAPSVHGLMYPRISLPRGIDRLLSEQELAAVLIHELTHAKRRDNLIRLVQEIGLCVLWFHPLVWLTGTRLSLYRELSCDESVIHRAFGRELVSALTKLANLDGPLLLQASVASFLGARLGRLAAGKSYRSDRTVNALLAVTFGSALLSGVYQTVAHTACCFLAKR